MDSDIYSKENVIKSAFKIFDKNTIGKISPNHLHELFLGMINPHPIFSVFDFEVFPARQRILCQEENRLLDWHGEVLRL